MAFNDNNPTDDWDNFGASQDAPNIDQGDDWDNWDATDSQSDIPQDSGDDDWSNFGDEGQEQSQQEDGWDGWNEGQSQQDIPQNGGFIGQTQEDWGSWDNQGGQNQTADNGFGDFENQQNYNNPVQESVPKQFNFSTKTVALILAGILVVIALLFMGIDKIHIKKNTSSNSAQQQQQVQQQQPQQQQPQQQQPQQQPQQDSSSTQTQQQEQSQQSSNVANDVGRVVLVEIPSSTTMNYATDVLTANGTVVGKTKYVQGNQILYCVSITIAFADSSSTVNYYCNYASYNQVSKGDLVVVTYQQVEDSYISINSISK